MRLNNSDCCGLMLMESINSTYPLNSEQLIKDFKKGGYGSHFRYVMFSDTKGGLGEKLSKFITEKGLGTITASEWARNPNSGNDLRIYTWSINWPKLKAFGNPKRIVKKKEAKNV